MSVPSPSAPLRIDPASYDLGDASATVRTMPRRWRWIVEGFEELPGPTRVVHDAIADVLASAGGVGDDLGTMADAVWRNLDALAARHGPRTPALDVLAPGDPLLIAAQDCDSLLSEAARSVVRELDVRGEGTLVRVSVSDGGAPKSSVGAARVTARGLGGDRQAVRAHHGRPFQAVSLYSAELVAALAREGHPIEPGSVGENLLLSGLDFWSLRPGVRLAVGPGVVLELGAYAPPCQTIAPAFADGRFDRVDHDKHPGWGRHYAWVFAAGTVTAGDEVAVVP